MMMMMMMKVKECYEILLHSAVNYFSCFFKEKIWLCLGLTLSAQVSVDDELSIRVYCLFITIEKVIFPLLNYPPMTSPCKSSLPPPSSISATPLYKIMTTVWTPDVTHYTMGIILAFPTSLRLDSHEYMAATLSWGWKSIRGCTTVLIPEPGPHWACPGNMAELLLWLQMQILPHKTGSGTS